MLEITGLIQPGCLENSGSQHWLPKAQSKSIWIQRSESLDQIAGWWFFALPLWKKHGVSKWETVGARWHSIPNGFWKVILIIHSMVPVTTKQFATSSNITWSEPRPGPKPWSPHDQNLGSPMNPGKNKDVFLFSIQTKHNLMNHRGKPQKNI